MGSRTGDGNHDDSNRSRVLADGYECGQMSAKPEVCGAADAYSAHGSRVMQRMDIANSRKNPFEAWRRLQKRYDPTTGGRKRNLLRTIISYGRCSLLELLAGIERWESYVSRYEKKLKDK